MAQKVRLVDLLVRRPIALNSHDSAVSSSPLQEWYAFIDTLIPKLIDVDDEIPFVKANDVAVSAPGLFIQIDRSKLTRTTCPLQHRINRDVRFSKDKTPYKRNLVSLPLLDAFFASDRRAHICPFPRSS